MESQMKLIESAFVTVATFDVSTTPSSNITSVVDAFRILRNSVAADENIAVVVVKDDRNLIKKTANILKNFADSNEEICLVLKRCALQFVGNVVSRVNEAKFAVFDEFRGLFVDFFSHEDAKIRTYISMVLFNCLNLIVVEDLCKSNRIDDDESIKIVKKIYELIKNDNIEWCLFIIERLLIDGESFLNSFWTNLSTDNQILSIEICRSMIESTEKRFPHESNVIYLIDVYVQLAGLLVPIDVAQTFDESQFCCLIRLFSPILTLFCKLTGDENDRYVDIRRNESLLESTVKILKRIQRISDSFFAVSKLATNSSSDDSDHPAYGLKRDLVNLIANLCYRSSEQQNLARQLDAVPLILDCTMMDGRNRFITQWAILALRNLLEDCPENQRLVSMLNPQYVIEKSEFFDELRLEPYLDEKGQVKLKTKQ